mgnify:CR=1 FL=1
MQPIGEFGGLGVALGVGEHAADLHEVLEQVHLLAGQGGGHLYWTNWGDAEARTANTDLLVVIPDQGADDPNGGSLGRAPATTRPRCD